MMNWWAITLKRPYFDCRRKGSAIVKQNNNNFNSPHIHSVFVKHVKYVYRLECSCYVISCYFSAVCVGTRYQFLIIINYWLNDVNFKIMLLDTMFHLFVKFVLSFYAKLLIYFSLFINILQDAINVKTQE